MTAFAYDRIGVGYTTTRRPDPRIARRIRDALGGARTLLNVGAGTGSYEPADLEAVALEPSLEMIRQRSSAAPVVRGMAEALPFADGAFDAALAVLTIHHWRDWRRGVHELRRVASSRVALFTVDIEFSRRFWLFDYFPGIIEQDRRRFPALEELRDTLDARLETVPVPHDCEDGFLGSRWRQPAAYLDPVVRRAISGFEMLSRRERDAGLAHLEADLRSGAWNERHSALREREALDLGYRLLVAELG